MPGTEPRLVDAENSSDATSIVVPVTKRWYYWECVLRPCLLLLHFANWILNVFTIIVFFNNHQVVPGFVTIGIWLGSGTVTTIISAWITADYEKPHANRDHERNTVQNFLQWIKFVVFQLALPQRHLQSLACTCKAYKMQEEITTDLHENLSAQLSRMHKEYRNIASLDLVNCCFKIAPAFILQGALHLRKNGPITTLVWIRIIAWCVDIVTCGLSMRSMHTTSRSTDPTRKKLGMVPSCWVYIWHTGTIGSRLMIITVGVSEWPGNTLEVCFFLCIAWMIWLYCKADARNAFCLKKTGTPREVFCALVVAYVYLLTFVNLKRGSTSCRQLGYSTVNLIVNIVCITVIRSCTTRSESVVMIAIYLLIFILYIVGNIAMIWYYTRHHPTWSSRKCFSSFCESLRNFFHSSQDTDCESDDVYTPLDMPAFDKRVWRFAWVLNRLLDSIGHIPTHSLNIEGAVILEQNDTPVVPSSEPLTIERISLDGGRSIVVRRSPRSHTILSISTE